MASPSAAHRFLERLSRAADGVRARLLDVYVRHGLNASGYQLLGTVASRGETGCSQTEIAAALQLAESSVCSLVDRLQQDGLMHRFRSRHDRRRSLLLLTPEGKARWLETSQAAEAALVRWMAETTDDELEQISRWLDALSVGVETAEPPAMAEDRAPRASAPMSRLREAG